MLKANVPESSAIAELLAVAISASADALALAASVVHRMPTALAAFLPLITSASADALALAAGVVLAAAIRRCRLSRLCDLRLRQSSAKAVGLNPGTS